LKFFKTDRCRICKKRKGHRFCIRKESNICWNDCNELRVDLRCPENCRYTLIKGDEGKISTFFEYKTNADSQTEFIDLLKREMDKWVISPQEFLDQETPIRIAETEEGKKQISDFFSGFNIPDYVPMYYLKQKLELTELQVKNKKKNLEEIAMDYLNSIIVYEWEDTLNYLHNLEKYSDQDLKSNYLNRISSNKILKKVKYYDLISSAIAEDKRTALVFFELQGKYELTLVLRFAGKRWFVSAKIFGRPELFNGENDAIQQIAVLLSKNKITEVFPLLQKYSTIYPDSSDLQYYWGLYYTFLQNPSKAKEYFYTAIELDPEFSEAKYNYAFILHSQKHIKEAKELYCEVLEANPHEIKSMNNLASILIDSGDHKEARDLLERCLKINKDFEIAQKNLERLNSLAK